MILSRRGVLRCLTGLIAAPAIVRADALMRVVAPRLGEIGNPVIGLPPPPGYEWRTSFPTAKWRMLNSGDPGIRLWELNEYFADLKYLSLAAPAQHRAEG
jgi:NCAIR mutase (PurE)-related protein